MKKLPIGIFSVLFICMLSACKKADSGTTPTPTATLSITKFNPKSAQPESDITITGTGFGSDLANVKVAVGTSQYDPPILVTPTTIVFKTNSATPSGKISVIVNGNKVTSTDDFTALPATLSITDFNPKSAKPYSNITITGTGFGSDLANVKVAVGTSPYDPPISVTPTTIVVKTNLATPSGKISVIVNGNKVISTDDFTALPEDPKIVGFDTSNGQLGHQMYMSGNGFVVDTNKMFISFGGTTPVKANYSYFGLDGIAIGTIVPRYAQAGKITLTIEGRSTTSDIDFPLHMSMRDFSPKIVSRGDTLKITGVAFTNTTDMAVEFNSSNVIVRPIKVTSTDMWVIVPSYAITGYLRISANYGTINDTFYDQKLQVK